MTLAAGEAGPDLRERLDREIAVFNAATGYHGGRLQALAARRAGGDLHAGLYWTHLRW